LALPDLKSLKIPLPTKVGSLMIRLLGSLYTKSSASSLGKEYS
jgi:hypothetical protein